MSLLLDEPAAATDKPATPPPHGCHKPPIDLLIAARIGLNEPTGLVMVSRVEQFEGAFDPLKGEWPTTRRYEVPAVERLPGGSSLSAVADCIQELVELATESGAERVKVAVDVSACGLPFMKLLQSRAAAVMIGDAARPRPDDRLWHVPMRELLAVAMNMLADGRLQVADVEQAAKLVEQLQAFKTKPAPKDQLSDWKPMPQTDLAQALMLGLWWSERMLRSITKQPPVPRQKIDPAQQPTFDQAMKMARRKRR